MLSVVSPQLDHAKNSIRNHDPGTGRVGNVVLGLLAVAGVLLCGAPAVSAAAVSGVDEVIFATRQVGSDGHWYANFGYYAFDEKEKLYRAGGRLCRLDLKTGGLSLLLDDPKGSVRDPQVHYDSRKILFSYRPGGSDYFHLYEINADGSGLRQLTSGPYDDVEPTYLPDGRIMFCSSRCNRWVNCWYVQVAILYCCDADGTNLQPVSANIEQDNTPWPLPDGRVIYERWEYVDRSRVGFHHLWTANPDGTGQMIYYGNLRPGTLMIDAKPIPGTDNQVVAVFSPGHGREEHAGAITLLTPKSGPDEEASAVQISEGDDYRDPYPLSVDCFLVARGPRLLAMDGRGKTRELYRLPEELIREKVELHEPRPLRPRQRERILRPRANAGQATGRLILTDVHVGRRMEGVRRGEIKKLLVLETLPKPINYSGKMPPMSFGGTYTLERVVGTVPVEEDGSAYMELPALRSFFFVALDKNNNSVKRMHSFLTVMPGETSSCVGCHEQRTRTPLNPGQGSVEALRRPASKITPLAGIPEVFDYPRHIQPILDRRCVECHDSDRREGRVILSGDRGPIFSHSYFTLTAGLYVSDGRDRLVTNLPPRSVGTSASPLMKMLDGSHYQARLSAHEQDMIRYWIESAAPYPGTYAALGSGMIGGFPRSVLDTSEQKWPVSIAAARAIRRRCTTCHDRSMPLPRHLSDNLGLVLSNPDFSDVRIRFSRHLLFNLSRPEKSLILLAPLAKQSGGYGTCAATGGWGQAERAPSPLVPGDELRSTPATPNAGFRTGSEDGRSGGEAIFADAADPDYQKILALCRAGKEHLEQAKRFDMPGFRPTSTYVREMKKYGILPNDLAENAPIDVYATDRAYWRSLWWQPDANTGHGR